MNRIFTIVSTFLILLPGTALAGGGFVPVVDFPSGTGLVDGATFGVAAKANRSYLCVVRVVNAKSSILTSITSPSRAPLTAIRPSLAVDATRYLNAFHAPLESVDDDPIDNVIIFTTPQGSIENGKYTLTLGISSGKPSYGYASCVDSTVICEFNTYLNQNVFLEVGNLGPVNGLATMRIVDSDGRVTSELDQFSFPAGLRKDIPLNSYIGINRYGYVILLPTNFSLTADNFAETKVSTYKNGGLANSVTCTNAGNHGQR